MSDAATVLSGYLEKVQNLTILPPVLISVLSTRDDNEIDVKKLELMIESDQMLVARLLRLANSPFYARASRQQVQSVNQTIMRLGFRTVRSMVTLAFADSIFASGNYAKFRKEVWEHSIATGILSQLICGQLHLNQLQESALLGGLLHDLGKITLNTLDRKKYVEVLTRFLENDRDVREFERELFGVDNVVLGSAAAKLWKLPEELIDAIALRYEPIPNQSQSVQAIAFAELMAKKSGYGRFLSSEETRYADYCELFGATGPREKQLREYCTGRLLEHDLYRFAVTL